MPRKIVWRALLVGPAAALALTQGLASAQAATPGWRASAVISTPSRNTLLDSVAAGDATHAWAVGFEAPTSSAGQPVPAIEAWNGSAWSPVSLPTGMQSALGQIPLLRTVSAAGPSNVWAFTELGGWLHYDGANWTAGKVTKVPVAFDSSLALGTGTGWAFGGALTGRTPTPYAAYHAGTVGWKRTTVPGTGAIVGASAVSSTDIWAVLGSSVFGPQSSSGSLVHWYGGAWHKVITLPAELRNGSLGSILARSDKDVWVGGAVKNSKGGTTEAVGHWNGRRWTVSVLHAAASAAKYSLVSIVGDGSGGIWAAGVCNSAKCPASPTRLWHETAGKWSAPTTPKLESQPTALFSLAAVGHSVWAAGGVEAGKNSANGLVALWGPTP